jgi:hypothetical protein
MEMRIIKWDRKNWQEIPVNSPEQAAWGSFILDNEGHAHLVIIPYDGGNVNAGLSLWSQTL